jgi:hypothetical protein
MIMIIAGANRPDDKALNVTTQLEKIYGALVVPRLLLDLAELTPDELFS